MEFASPQQGQEEEIPPNSWEQLRRLDEVAANVRFHNYFSADAGLVADTTDALNDEEIVRLVSATLEVSDNANHPNTTKPPVPDPGQVMDAVELLRRFADAFQERPR